MKKNPFSLLLLTLCLLFVVSAGAEAKTEQFLQSEVTDFVNTTLSDFAAPEAYKDALIDEDAPVFRRYVKDMRAINRVQNELHGKKIETAQDLLSYEVERVRGDLYLTTLRLGHHFRLEDQDAPMYAEATYKLLVDQSKQPFLVVGGITTTLSSGFLLPEDMHKEPDELAILAERQEGIPFTPPARTKLDYRLDEVIADLRGQYKEMYAPKIATLRIGQAYYDIDGERVALSAAPAIKDDYSFVPLGFFERAYGHTVSWDGTARIATLRADDKVFQFYIDEKKVTYDGKTMQLPGAFIVEDRTLVPLRFIAEELGLGVDYHHADRSISITEYAR